MAIQWTGCQYFGSFILDKHGPFILSLFIKVLVSLFKRTNERTKFHRHEELSLPSASASPPSHGFFMEPSEWDKLLLRICSSLLYSLIYLSLGPQTKLWEGNVFTGNRLVSTSLELGPPHLGNPGSDIEPECP